MVFRTRYLLLMALMMLTINWINTTGEYILGSIVKEQASAMVAAGTAGGLSEGQIIGDFYAKYFSLANLTGLLLQLFVVSRIIRHRGVAVAVMILPALSFGAYNILAFVPLLNAALAAKVIENSTDYSLNNTVRNMLFLPCTYEQKFAAKQAIDSFFVRMGDVLSAALVFGGTTFLALSSARLRGGECGARHPLADPGVACRPLLQDPDGAARHPVGRRVAHCSFDTDRTSSSVTTAGRSPGCRGVDHNRPWRAHGNPPWMRTSCSLQKGMAGSVRNTFVHAIFTCRKREHVCLISRSLPGERVRNGIPAPG